ncbi:MAG: SDR family oxidoreductase [Rhizobiaceae bacterium]|nr:SDR family oxidoreductase [Rhizobiaceae bacterium]
MPQDFSNSIGNTRIAIAGATGRIGLALTSLLIADQAELVVLTRQPGGEKLPSGVDVAAVDFDRPETLRDALTGADRLFISHGTSAQQVANEIALIDNAVAAGVRHIVKISAMGPASRLNPFAWHMEIEAHLARQPIASTVLRPSAFADVLKRAAADIVADTWAGAAGNGRVNFIDTLDVAKVAHVALHEDVQPESQRAYHLTGQRAWTLPQVAEELSVLLGRPVTYGHLSLEQQRAKLASSGLPSMVVDILLGLDQVYRESILGETTSTVEELTGERPRSLSQWLTENLAIFR